MKIASRLIIFFMLLALLSTSLVSCTSSGNDMKSNDVSGGSTSENSKGKLFSNLPDVNYNNEEISILVEGDVDNPYQSVEICPNESSPSIIKDSVALRNARVEEKFGVKISEVRAKSSEIPGIIRNNQLGGTDLFDIVMPYIPDAAPLALDDYFYKLNDYDNIHLDKDYWDQGAVKGLSINNKNYFVTGDFSLLSLDCTHAIVFNKDMIASNNLESPYDLVSSGKWTLDKLREMAKKVTQDSDGVSGMTYKDTYGFLVNTNFVTSMYIGSGERLTNKDTNDLPYITVNSERGINVFNKIYDLVNDTQATGHIESFSDNAKADGKTEWQVATESVANKKTLFRAMSIIDMISLGDYDCNFGIIPVPKYDETQTDYYSVVSTVRATCAAIPVTNHNVEQASIILDALCQASTDTVKYSYYQVLLKNRKIQDDESENMLDLIFNNRVYELGIVFGWGGKDIQDSKSISSFLNSVAFNGSNTFVSTYDSIKDVIQQDIDKTNEKFK